MSATNSKANPGLSAKSQASLGYVIMGLGTANLIFAAYHAFFAQAPNVWPKVTIEMKSTFGVIEILIGLCFLRWKTKSPSSRDAPSQANELGTNTRLAQRRENQEEGDD